LAFHILLVAIIEWDLLFPVMKLLPVMAQTLGMGTHSVSVKISASIILSYHGRIARKIDGFRSLPTEAGLRDLTVAFWQTM